MPDTARLPALPQTHIRISHDHSELASAVVAMAVELAKTRQLPVTDPASAG